MASNITSKQLQTNTLMDQPQLRKSTPILHQKPNNISTNPTLSNLNTPDNRKILATFLVQNTSLERLEQFFEEHITEFMELDNTSFLSILNKCKAIGFTLNYFPIDT